MFSSHRAQFSQRERVLLSNFPVHAKAPASAAVLDGSDLVHGHMRYTIGTRSFRELLRLMWQIRRFGPDVLVYVMPRRGENAVKRDALFFRLCGITRVVGLPSGDMETNRHDPETGLFEREASRLLRCIHELGDEDVSDLRNWDLRLTKAELDRADGLLEPLGDRPIIACGPGTKMPSKDWGAEKWRELLGRLNAEFPQHGLVLVGAREDSAVSEYASGGWRGAQINLCGMLTPRESAAVLRRTCLFSGTGQRPYAPGCVLQPAVCDSFHIAGFEREMVSDWRSPQPHLPRLPCSNCALFVCVERSKVCINSISVEEMFTAAIEAMNYQEIRV